MRNGSRYCIRSSWSIPTHNNIIHVLILLSVNYRLKFIGYVIILSSICLLNKYHILSFCNKYVAYFMSCYFNDIFGSTILLLLIGIVLSFYKKIKLKLYQVELFMLFCGIVWEFITPLYRSDTTTDIIDLLAYLLGGILFWYTFGGKAYFSNEC